MSTTNPAATDVSVDQTERADSVDQAESVGKVTDAAADGSGSKSAQHTPRQLEVLRHALGLKPDGSGRAHRAHFVTGPGSCDFDDCEALVAIGFMVKHPASELSGGDPVYLVTPTGSAIAKATGSAA